MKVITHERQATYRTPLQTTDNQMAPPSGYMLGWILGTLAGGIALLKINLGGFWDVGVALLISAATGLFGALGTHAYNILLKDRIARLLKRKKKK